MQSTKRNGSSGAPTPTNHLNRLSRRYVLYILNPFVTLFILFSSTHQPSLLSLAFSHRRRHICTPRLFLFSPVGVGALDDPQRSLSRRPFVFVSTFVLRPCLLLLEKGDRGAVDEE